MNPYEELVGALCSAGFDESKFTRDKGKFASHPGGTSEKEIRSSDVRVGDYIGDNRVVRSEKKDATTHVIQTEGGPPEELPADAPVLVKREKDGPLPSNSLLDELRARRNNPGYKPGGKTTTDTGYKWRKISQAERKKSKLAASAGFDESKVTRDKGQFSTHSGTGPSEEPASSDQTVFTNDEDVAQSNKASTALVDALDPDSQDLISEYTDDIASSELNEELNDGVSADELLRSDVDQALQSAIAAEKDLGLAPPATVYRGITHFDAADFEIGSEVEAPAYSSTSVRPDIANTFTDEFEEEEGRAVLEIIPLAGTGAHVAALSENSDEAEYVIGRGSRFEVMEITSAVFANGPDPEYDGTTAHKVIKLRQTR